MSAAEAPGVVTLLAPDPRSWFDTHLLGHQSRHETVPVDPAARRWLGLADLLVDDAALLRGAHAGVLRDGGTPQMAAKWLVAWLGGAVADAVGFVWGIGGAGVLLDPERLRLRLHPDGWVDRVALDGAQVLVTARHPWAGRPDVTVVPEAELLERTVASLVATVEPVVQALRVLSPVGARSMWAEVVDRFGMSVTLQPGLPVEPDVVRRLQAAMAVPGAPWRVAPTLRTATAPWSEPVYLAQKGGCCLAFQRAGDGAGRPRPDDARLCGTCPVRGAADSEARQLAWLDQVR